MLDEGVTGVGLVGACTGGRCTLNMDGGFPGGLNGGREKSAAAYASVKLS